MTELQLNLLNIGLELMVYVLLLYGWFIFLKYYFKKVYGNILTNFPVGLTFLGLTSIAIPIQLYYNYNPVHDHLDQLYYNESLHGDTLFNVYGLSVVIGIINLLFSFYIAMYFSKMIYGKDQLVYAIRNWSKNAVILFCILFLSISFIISMNANKLIESFFAINDSNSFF